MVDVAVVFVLNILFKRKSKNSYFRFMKTLKLLSHFFNIRIMRFIRDIRVIRFIKVIGATKGRFYQPASDSSRHQQLHKLADTEGQLG